MIREMIYESGERERVFFQKKKPRGGPSVSRRTTLVVYRTI